ncbi:MAG: hypothetical protein DYG98_01020 [Haliscomenobacteraceae bacterium CHB4]|nr:hypothetical protein [Haliscomenobacteraceae bacterium CHB4]
MNSIEPDVTAYLIRQLTTGVASPDNKVILQDFIHEMGAEGHFHGHRLLYSMAIDLKSGALQPPVIREAILQVPVKKEFLRKQLRSLPVGAKIPTLAAFGRVLREMLERDPAETSVFQATTPDPYIHICALRAFMKYLTPHKDFGEYDEARKMEIREIFSVEFAELAVASLGPPNGLVYVTHEESLAATAGLKDRAAHLADGLGLSPWDVKPGTELVVVHYPGDFDRDCYQPCCLNAYWGNVMVEGDALRENMCNPCYLSYYKLDEYGRTFSISSAIMPMRERVHRSFAGLDKGYLMQAELLEPIQNPIPEVSSDPIRKEGYGRFLSC